MIQFLYAMGVSVQHNLLCYLGKRLFSNRCKTKLQQKEIQKLIQHEYHWKCYSFYTDLAATAITTHLLTFCLKINSISSVSRQEWTLRILKNEWHIKKTCKLHNFFKPSCWWNLPKFIQSEKKIRRKSVVILQNHNLNLRPKDDTNDHQALPT